ncbi:HU family DNA-binding protein [Sphaerobacter sp.]|uniref:HU family DNA-binding protein n=1 Tax=Sphaerobacter sp. TaxID=2099654 RepID=UPI001D4A056F|nr:HU family DNA-binding protein [Sphaerobacter sp.]MBX5443610.1 HU family DNA-binding protein [Sphaerobacter sp.]
MRKSDLVKAVARKVQQPESHVSTVVNATFEAIREALASGDEVAITGFGTFRISERGAREGRNPQTGERITIPSRRSPSFKPGTQLKRAVSGEAAAAD